MIQYIKNWFYNVVLEQKRYYTFLLISFVLSLFFAPYLFSSADIQNVIFKLFGTLIICIYLAIICILPILYICYFSLIALYKYILKL